MIVRIAILVVAIVSGPVWAADAPGVEFFEKTVRPVFLEHCVKCHSEKKQSAGLRLDSVAGIKKGADDGPIYVAGKSQESRIVKSINHGGDNAMPPDRKLPADVIANIAAWIDRGAPMPEAVNAKAIDVAKSHWAFQPLKTKSDVGSIDHFIGEKLKSKGMSFSPAADPRQLIRRLYFDVIGLPPTYEQVEAFAKDPSAKAYAEIVDTLLASPQYGERWARHWLDVARYSDTKGYVFTEDRNYPYAFTYRDYVINAFNEDKPYSQFIIEQIAADKLKLNPGNPALAAMGFLTVGRRFNNNVHDIIDDRIEVVTRGFLGLSVGCARCHDHKFDPVPIADYYSLYGVFNSSVEPKELPLIGEMSPEARQFEVDLVAAEKLAKDFHDRALDEALVKYRDDIVIADYLLAAARLQGQGADKVDALIRDWKLNNVMLDHWRKALDRSKAKSEPVFAAWHAFAALPPAEFATRAAAIKGKIVVDSPKHNAAVRAALADVEPKSLADVAAIYAGTIATALRDKQPDKSAVAIVELINGPRGPFVFDDPEFEAIVPVAVKKQYRVLRNAAQKMRSSSPNAPPRAMVMNDAAKPVEPFVFLRGNPGNRGPKVPRQFLGLISSNDRTPFKDGSGRLELAQAIADSNNALTWRVIVNRVWAWHFGQGLVRTPSDFGVRSDAPSHPEFLDWLAVTFRDEDKGSLKALHRRILLSRTYQQSSAVPATLATADPDNALLSRFPRLRLEFEPLRDAMLAAGGVLDTTRVGGRSEDIFKAPFSHRRSVYTFVERQNLPGTLRSFDFANPDQHMPQRYVTTVPQQALFLMNSPFATSMANAVVKRREVASAANDAERVNAIVRAVYGRDATPTERASMLEYVNQAPQDTPRGAWEQLAQALLMSNEFAYVD